MRSHLLKPSPPLAPYVEFYIDLMISSHEASGRTSSEEPIHTHRIFPSPTASVAFNYQIGNSTVSVGNGVEQPCNGSSLGGYFTGPKKYSLFEPGGVFIICFKPLGIRRFTRFPVQESLDLNIDLHHAFGPVVAEWEEQISECRSVAARKGKVEEFLLSRFNEQVDHRIALDAIDQITQGRGTIQIADLATTYQLSRKQFDRKFLDATGMSPKLFSRLIRFQYTLQLLRQSLRTIDVAYESGFFDQAHFIHDFRQMSGVSPGRFLATSAPTPLGEEIQRQGPMSRFYNTLYE